MSWVASGRVQHDLAHYEGRLVVLDFGTVEEYWPSAFDIIEDNDLSPRSCTVCIADCVSKGTVRRI